MLISYSHDSEGHQKAVLALTNRLREAGVDAWIDQFEEHRPPGSWPTWMRRELDKADFVLVVVTANYRERFDGESPLGVGSGVRWEGTWITADLYHGRQDKAKFLPVVLRREDQWLIPTPLNLTTSYVIGEGEDADFWKLVRVLHASPAAVPAALGSLSSAADSPGQFKDVTSPPEIAAALAKAREGNVEDALRQLRHACARLHGEQQAQAVYLFGVLSHRLGDMGQALESFQWVLDNTHHADLRVCSLGLKDIVSAEWNTHYGEHGPVAAAHSWLNLLRRKWKAAEVWKRLDDNLRLALAQDWIIANAEHPVVQGEDRDLLARALAQPKPSRELAKPMLDGRIEALRGHYAGWDPDTWAAPGPPRRVGLDYEIVVLAPADESTQGFPLLMRRVGREWLVANFQSAYVIPGWPPRQEEIPGP
ncbi:hypothetical protein TN53_31640 [Streptomyces sp. WM6386]|nr:hypothetical protein TN53_31640 [Streptomyces sp. WM6386]